MLHIVTPQVPKASSISGSSFFQRNNTSANAITAHSFVCSHPSYAASRFSTVSMVIGWPVYYLILVDWHDEDRARDESFWDGLRAQVRHRSVTAPAHFHTRSRDSVCGPSDCWHLGRVHTLVVELLRVDTSPERHADGTLLVLKN